MKKNTGLKISGAMLLLHAVGCTPLPQTPPIIPSEDYVRELKGIPTTQVASASAISEAAISTGAAVATPNEMKARLRFVDDTGVHDEEMVRNPPTMHGDMPNDTIPGVKSFKSNASLTRDYQGPLDLGDPGVQSSLWRESRGANDMLRDDRGWQAGDLITIAVTENDQGTRQAQTNTKSESTLATALSNFFGIAGIFSPDHPKEADLNGGKLISASSTQEFKGQGLTNRTNSLKGRISVMVAEVLPTGILRIEGKKIVSVNEEDQIMILSGLVRLRDINSDNEVDSSKVANMRIDYFGKGTVDEAQTPGWGTRLIKTIWPF